MLPKSNRLTKEADFKMVASKARPTHSKYLILKKLFLPNTASKFGIVISTKVSKKSTIRNKIKRRLANIIHHELTNIKAGQQVLLVVKNTVLDQTFEEIKNDLIGLFKKTGVL